MVHALAGDAARRHHVGHVVGSREHVRVAHHDQGPGGRAVHQPQLRLEDGGQRGLGADERARDIEAVLGQQRRQVVARDAPGDVGEAGTDLVRVPVTQVAHAAVDLSDTTRRRDGLCQRAIIGGADRQARSVVGEDVELEHVVLGSTGHHRVHAARVVADHAAEGAVGVGRRVGPEGEVMDLGCVAQLVEHDAGADPCGASIGVEVDQRIVVLRMVEDDRHVAGLAGQARAAAAGHDRDVVGPAHLDRRDHVVGITGHDHADRHLAVVRGIGAVRRTAAGVEPDLAADLVEQIDREPLGLSGQLRGGGPPDL